MISGNSMAFKVLFFDAKQYDRDSFECCNRGSRHQIHIRYIEPRLDKKTVKYADGFDCVCIFVNDTADKDVIECLVRCGVKMIALRCAGVNNVDVDAAKISGMKVVRVPAYSPYAVAEFAIGLLMCLNRKIHTAYNRIRRQNFQINGLVGFNMFKKTVGVIGTGKIGKCAISILRGFDCTVLAHDVYHDNEYSIKMGFDYKPIDEIYRNCKVIFLFTPLTAETRHMINQESIGLMQPGTVLINTSCGSLIDSPALLQGLYSGKIGAAGLDVYENEEKYFFRDTSEEFMDDDQMAALIGHPHVLLTSHNAYLTKEALRGIAEITLENIYNFLNRKNSENEVA